MRYKTKSILLGRKKSKGDDDSVRPCFIGLYQENNPHLSEKGPFEVLEFDQIYKVEITGLDVNYLLPGNDIAITDLDYIDVEKDGSILFINGKQKKH